MIGAAFGDLVFEVSSETVKTFDTLKFNKKATYSTHKVHGGTAVPEFTGFEAETASFKMVLSAYLGVDPKSALQMLESMMQEKKAYTLALGTNVYGKWAITSLSENYERIHKDGTLLSCTVDVNLTRTE